MSTCAHPQLPRPVDNPPNPWSSTHVEYLDEPPPARLEVFHDHARSILARNDSPDIPFRWSLNPYRGCMHACAYCYARPSHQHLGFGAGTDFDRKIVVKVNAPELLAEAFAKPSWQGELIAFSGNTDCYQPLEASYALTRACLEVCADYRNPVGVITKSALVRRDADVLARIARDSRARAMLSIPFARDEDALKIEPWAARVSRRFEALRALSDAGVPTGDAGSGLGARVVFAHASPNFGSFGLCVGISGIPLVADTVKVPNLQAAPGSNFLLNLDNGTVSGSIAQATAFSSVVAYEQLSNTQLANAKIEYWAMKNVSAGTSCRSAFGFNPLSPSANARKLGEIAYASLKSGAGYVAAVTGCVTSGGTKSGNTNLCGPDYGSNTPNLKLSVVQVPSGPVGSGTVGASFVHLASSAVSRGLASATLKFAAQGGGTSNCPFRLTTIGTASYLTASPLANATFGGAVPLTASDVTSGSQFGVQVANGDGNICGNLASLTAPVVASLSAGGTPGTSYFTQQSGKSMVFLLIGDATVQNPANGGDWTDPWLRVIALPSSP